MYGNPYMSAYNPQVNIDRINKEIAELEKLKQQIPNQQVPTPTNLTQNFQLTPNNHSVIKFASSLEEVQKEMVIGDTPFFSKDMSVVWVKSSNGSIKTYELNEIVEKDAKDMQIEYLQAQINELKKGMINNEQFDPNVNEEQITTNTTGIDEPIREPIKEEKSSSVQRVSTSKKR